MPTYSTQQAADKVGVSKTTLLRWLTEGQLGKVPITTLPGGVSWRLWTDVHIKRARKVKASQQIGRPRKASRSLRS